jgi:hypothetical protein
MPERSIQTLVLIPEDATMVRVAAVESDPSSCLASATDDIET